MPILVETIPSGPPFQSNCYLLRAAPDAAQAVVVDPGGEAAEVLAALRRTGSRLAAILVTHTDVDHVAGVAELARGSGAAVYAPAAEAAALRDGETRGGLRVAPHAAEHELAGGEQLALAGMSFEVVAVPGHSPGHLAFCSGGNLFSGDLLFAGSVGRSDLAGGDSAALLASVRRLLGRYGPGATVYPGHGAPTTLGQELASNPFLAALREE